MRRQYELRVTCRFGTANILTVCVETSLDAVCGNLFVGRGGSVVGRIKLDRGSSFSVKAFKLSRASKNRMAGARRDDRKRSNRLIRWCPSDFARTEGIGPTQAAVFGENRKKPAR